LVFAIFKTFCSKYWCIDGKYRIYVALLRTGERGALASLSIRYEILVRITVKRIMLFKHDINSKMQKR
jgi:hypothetical protein